MNDGRRERGAVGQDPGGADRSSLLAAVMTARQELARQAADQLGLAGIRFAKGVVAGDRAVGRDWHDVLAMGDRIALVVGQVPRQRDEESARVVVERLRGVITAQLLHGCTAAETVLALHRYAGFAAEAAGATLCLAVFEPATRSVRCASAGHPGVLVITEHGVIRQLVGSRSGPLATGYPARAREALETVGERETVLLYSTELGRCHPDVRLETLATSVVAETGADPRALCERLTGRLSCSPDAGDAVALVFTPTRVPVGPFALSFPAEAGRLSALRHELADWLGRVGVSEEDTFAFVLAVGEAAANSIEHGYRSDSATGTITVTAESGAGGATRVTVSDDGHWRYPPLTDHSRGRGLLIMRESMDEVLVHRGAHGTVVTLCKRPSSRADRNGQCDPGGYEVRVRQVEGAVRVELGGELPASVAPALRKSLLTAARGGVFPLRLDLSDVGRDTEGLVLALFSVADAAAAAGQPLVLAAPDPSPVREALATAGLHRIARVTDILETAS
ncbi:ATP-binding protein [Allokutzneria oryzae]|uniref:ATP-binding protein n=1 Tax=Allokutzneria oryzae TaxID=1378989 RepID=A0ABV5ZQW1_9PSEU